MDISFTSSEALCMQMKNKESCMPKMASTEVLQPAIFIDRYMQVKGNKCTST